MSAKGHIRSEHEKAQQRVYKKRYYAKNKERLIAETKNWYQANKDKYNIRRNAWRKRSEAYRKSLKEYYDNNRDKIHAWAKKSYAKNRTEINLRRSVWKKNNKDKVNYHTMLRRVRKAGALVGDSKEIYRWEQSWRHLPIVECNWCKDLFSGNQCCPDHIIPLSKGGSHSLGNLCISCRPCNLRKRDMMPNEWMELLVA